MTEPLRLILDTNVVIDWLVFDHDYLARLRAAISAHDVLVLTHQAAIDELQRVLSYPQLKIGAPRQQLILDQYLSQTVIAPTPSDYSLDNLMLPPGFPRCRDRDDQHFLALAFHGHAHAIVSRDKAVLKLQKRARRFGVTVLNVAGLMSLPAFGSDIGTPPVVVQPAPSCVATASAAS